MANTADITKMLEPSPKACIAKRKNQPMAKANATKAEIRSPIDLHHIPNGEYRGVWGGYEVNAVIHGTQYRFDVNTGIRTPRADCVVCVENGCVTIETVQA